MTLRMRVYEREQIGAALRRFKKLLERSGITKELHNRKFYVKPCGERRRPARCCYVAVGKRRVPRRKAQVPWSQSLLCKLCCPLSAGNAM